MTARRRLLGRRFGRLIIERVEENRQNNGRLRVHCICRCECGTMCRPRMDSLLSGSTVSCGCYAKDHASSNGSLARHARLYDKSIGHGTRLYAIWRNAINRTTNPRATHYADYGGRGIVMAAKWVSDYPAFATYILKLPNAPTQEQLARPGRATFSLDRKNNDKGYFPGNLQWQNHTWQSRNRRSNVMYKGRPLIYWVELSGLPYNTVYQRVFKLGWSFHRALNTPVSR